MKKKFLFLCFVFFVQTTFAQFYSCRTNLIGLSSGNLNIEAAMTLNKKWSLHLPIQYNPFIFSSSNNTKFQNLTVMPGARYWFHETFRDYFMGLSAITSKYNVSNILDNYRYKGSALGFGCSIGCAYPLSNRFNIEWEGGLSALHCSYDKYSSERYGYYFGHNYGWRIIPHKISLNIVYLF